MNTKELRNAAEQLVALKRHSVTSAGQDWCQEIMNGIKLAKAYLAEHAEDDNKPVTLKWLRASIDERFLWVMYRGENEMLPYLLAKESHGTAWVLAGKTRGEVRRLCDCLGIDLKEGE